MSERDRAAVRVDLGRVHAELFADAERLCRKCFIEFDPVQILFSDTRKLERTWYGLDRTDAHDLKLDARVCPANNAPHRLRALMIVS